MTYEHYVSPTQIKNWRDCPRKVLWQIVKGIKVPSGKAAEKGNQIHAKLEQYLKEGTLDYTKDKEALETLEPALRHFPNPGDCDAEGKFKFKWHDLWFVGRYDALQVKSEINAGRVYDLKTTSDKKWAKDEPELVADPQPIIYFKAFENAVDSCRWVYTLTRGPKKAWAVDFKPVQSGPVVDLLIKDAGAIVKAVTDKIDPLKVPPPEDKSVCSAYGGCPYRSYCTDLSPLVGIQKRDFPLMGMAEIEARMRGSLKEEPQTTDINPPEVADAGPPPAPEEAKKRGRKKALPVVAPEVASQSMIAASPKPNEVGTVPADEQADGAIPPLTIAMLFIDCLPRGKMGADVIDVSSAITAVTDALREKNIENYRFLEYGQGAGVIASKTIEALARTEANKKGELLLFLDSRLPESKLVQGELTAKASLVIQGV